MLGFNDIYANDHLGLTLNFFTAISNFFPRSFYLGKCYDILLKAFGKFSKSSEYLKISEYQTSRSLFDL